MAKTYAVDGVDFTSINAACTEIEASHDYAVDGIAEVDVSITTADTTEITVGAASAGTPSITAYIRIEATAAAKHGGAYTTSKQRVEGNPTSNSAMINVSEDFLHLKHLQVKVTGTGASDECIRLLSGVKDVLIEKCIVYTNDASQQDGIYAGNWAVTDIGVFDCLLKCGGSNARTGIHAQNFNGSNDQLWHIEHCTIDADGSRSAYAGDKPSAQLTDVHIWNCVAFDAAITTDYDANGANFVNGNRGNISSDTSSTGEFGAGANNHNSVPLKTTDEAGDAYLVTDLTGDSEDYQLIDGVNTTDKAIGNAVSGATQDSRIDLTVDCAGNPRPGTYTDRDSGAFEVIAAGGVTLVVQDADHLHDADNLDLVQANVLAMDDADHLHVADLLALIQANVLTVADSDHLHDADLLALIQANVLAINDADHLHDADLLALIQANVLAVNDADHLHDAENIVLDVGVTLVVADADHLHDAENLDLIQANVLVVADADHLHDAENLDLIQANVLVVADADHLHDADLLALIQANVLVVAEAFHAHFADNLILFGVGQLPDGLIFVIDQKDRFFTISGKDRGFSISGKDRIFVVLPRHRV